MTEPATTTDDAPSPTAAELRDRLTEVSLSDELALGRRIAATKKIRNGRKRRAKLRSLDAEIAKASTRIEKRRAGRPKVTYPDDLPIAERRDELLAAIAENQVVIVAGETGSGKSTQLPKMCLELGRGVRGLIGHTQPRRIAARTVAERVADELGTTVGGAVGYTVRFTDEVSDKTLVKLMTDGILLAEMQRDRRLLRYDTLIIDEAHERSLNIDFLLGYLRQLLPQRPDLKVIITSATIDTERFSAHFDDAPVIEVSGRTYPVEVRYRDPQEPSSDGQNRGAFDQAAAIADAVVELQREGPGDILVFCSGERDIRDATAAVEKLRLSDTEILPLYARLPAAEQHKVFEPHRRRRVVIATNVAETSLTVPGVRYVVDSGEARISRYSLRTKVQRLPIEAISQASADQRAGRCGRLGPGVCIRLYSEDDFDNRAAFTEPEIQRTNLASVILQMASLGFGDIAAFPFVDRPDDRSITDGVTLLHELGAIDPDRAGTDSWVTPMGRQLVKLPVDPRLGRMVVEGDRNGCLSEAMVIASALSLQDVRERPAHKRPEADEHHERFLHPASDFLSIVDLWDYLQRERRDRSSNQFRRLCGREFLNFNRIREWQSIHRQLVQVGESLGFRRNNNPADADLVHRAVLTGLLSHIGMNDGESHDYRGARGARFVIAPGSALYKQSPQWVMAGELVETDRLRARVVARIDPDWVEEAADHLVKRTHGDPWWDRARGAAMTDERVTLFGLPLIPRRPMHVATVDASAARELFLHHALIHGEWETEHEFVRQNESVFEEVVALEARSRRRDLFVEYETLFAFYDTRIPSHISTASEFDHWWAETRVEKPHLLHLVLDELIDVEDAAIDEEAFPTTWNLGELDVDLSYEFDHASPNDGVTVTVPVAAFGQLVADDFNWNVPGLREDLVTALMRSLPKNIRKDFVPIPDTVAELLPALEPGELSLTDALHRQLSSRTKLTIPADALDVRNVPDYLRPSFRIVDADGTTLAHGKELDELHRAMDSQVKSALAKVGGSLVRTGLTQWDFGTLPRTYETEGPHVVTAFPALVDQGETVDISLLATEAEQRQTMWSGTRKLLRLSVAAPLRILNDQLSNQAHLALAVSPYPSRKEWFEDCISCGLDAIMTEQGGPAWNADDFAALQQACRDGLADQLDLIGAQGVRLLLLSAEVTRGLTAITSDRYQAAVRDMQLHHDRLIYTDYLTGLGAHRLADVDRYLQGIAHRLGKLTSRAAQDAEHLIRIRDLEGEYHAVVDRVGWNSALEDVAWMLEELRVSTFAQPIGAVGKVSARRIRTALKPFR